MPFTSARPRGFCAGVDRAIQIVELALEKYGSPVYVRHEIVHNKFVVDGLKAKGAVFVEELEEIPAGHTDRPVIFSCARRTEIRAGRRPEPQDVLPRRHLSLWSRRFTRKRKSISAGTARFCSSVMRGILK